MYNDFPNFVTSVYEHYNNLYLTGLTYVQIVHIIVNIICIRVYFVINRIFYCKHTYTSKLFPLYVKYHSIVIVQFTQSLNLYVSKAIRLKIIQNYAIYVLNFSLLDSNLQSSYELEIYIEQHVQLDFYDHHSVSLYILNA